MRLSAGSSHFKSPSTRVEAKNDEERFYSAIGEVWKGTRFSSPAGIDLLQLSTTLPSVEIAKGFDKGMTEVSEV